MPQPHADMAQATQQNNNRRRERGPSMGSPQVIFTIESDTELAPEVVVPLLDYLRSQVEPLGSQVYVDRDEADNDGNRTCADCATEYDPTEDPDASGPCPETGSTCRLTGE